MLSTLNVYHIKMRFLTTFFIALIVSTSAYARPMGGAQSFRSPSPPYYFRSTIGGNFASNYNWYGEQVIGASNAVAQGNGSPSRFPNSTIQWNINPGDTPIPDLATERDEFLFAFKGSPGYDVTVYGMYECIAKAFYLPAGWTDSVLDAVESKTLVTNGTTAAGNATLNFSGTGGNIGTNCFAGAFITDTTSAVIPLNTTVSSRTSTTVVMSANATGGGVGSGDTILCGSQWFFAGQLHADTEVAPGVNPPQAAFGWDIRAGHLWEHIWGGYASLGYSATNTNIDLGPYVKGQWTDVETCINFDAGTGVTGRSNGLVQAWTRTCD